MSASECVFSGAQFRGGLSAAQVDSGLKQALTELQSAEKSAVLWFAEIMHRRLFRDLGYSSIHLYASEALGFTASKTSQFIRLAESFEKLPALKASVASGELSWTKAREVARVATPASEKAWVAEARRSSRSVLERKVAAVKERSRQERRADPAQMSLGDDPAPGTGTGENVPLNMGLPGLAPAAAPPVALTFRLDGLQLARFDAIMERLRRLGVQKSREELLLEALASFAESVSASTEAKAQSRSGDTGKPIGGNERTPAGAPFTRVNSSPYQIVLYKCETCGGAHVVTSQGMRAVSSSALARAECDAQVQKGGAMNRATIPPATKRAVLLRDGHRCSVQGCGNTRFLEVHHVKPRREGGSNKPENLITLCSACHELLHDKGLAGSLSAIGPI